MVSKTTSMSTTATTSNPPPSRNAITNILLVSRSFHARTSDLHCPGTWDGWRCVPDTAAGTSTYIQCPDWILGFDPESKYKHTQPRPMMMFQTNNILSRRRDRAQVLRVKWRMVQAPRNESNMVQLYDLCEHRRTAGNKLSEHRPGGCWT